MSKLKTALSMIGSLSQSIVTSPRETIDALNLVPAVAQGIHFLRTQQHPVPGEAPADLPKLNPLQDYFDAHTEGPGLWKWSHYFDIYHQHLQKFVGKEVHVLEVGIYSGGGLQMWSHYFGEKSRLHGMDIAPACMSYQSEHVTIHIGDQSDRKFWSDFRKKVPRVDVLLDDGSHDPEHQRITLEEMLPHIQPGGVYLCEDIGNENNRFAGFIGGLVADINTCRKTVEEFDAPVQPSGFQASIKSITQYPSVTVIEKREYNPGLFISRKQGTEWQPY